MFRTVVKKFYRNSVFTYLTQLRGIEHQSKQAETFHHHNDRLNRSLDQSKILELEFSQRKFQNSNFHFIHFTNEYSPTLYHYYNMWGGQGSKVVN